MWPGSDLPVGPPPHRPPPPLQEPPRIRPSGGWFALPAVLLAIALILVAGVVAANWDEAEAADGPRASGDARAGIKVELTGGYDYFVFVRNPDPAPTSCTLRYPDEDAGPVALTRTNSWAATPPSGYRWAATFTATLTGTAELTCEGTAGPVQVVPDDTSYGYMGLALIAGLFLGGGAILAFILILVMRMNSAKRRRAATSPPTGLYGY